MWVGVGTCVGVEDGTAVSVGVGEGGTWVGLSTGGGVAQEVDRSKTTSNNSGARFTASPPPKCELSDSKLCLRRGYECQQVDADRNRS